MDLSTLAATSNEAATGNEAETDAETPCSSQRLVRHQSPSHPYEECAASTDGEHLVLRDDQSHMEDSPEVARCVHSSHSRLRLLAFAYSPPSRAHFRTTFTVC